MSFAKVHSAQTVQLDAHIIDVEVDLSSGLHAFSIVGLPDKAVEESRDRVAAAIKNSGFTSPKSTNKKIVISLAPADTKKEGPLFDLAIAVAYLIAAKDLETSTEGKLFLGELSLDGGLRPIRGVLPLVEKARQKGFRQIFVPAENAEEAALVTGVAIYAATRLSDVVEHLKQDSSIFLAQQPQTIVEYKKPKQVVDFSDVVGQESAKRGLEIAASGGHNVAMYGPPGTGKTMLARALQGILPKLAFEEMLEVTSIHSIAGALDDVLVTHPPFRAPHHTASYVSLVGGGTTPKPGEITLAHRGVLFLDEFPEFDRRVIEALRQPLEEGVVSVSRAKGSARFPANVILVAAMNPCPCGNFGNNSESSGQSRKICTCTPSSLERYRRKLSGPIVDRIDIWLSVDSVDHKKLAQNSKKPEASSFVRDRVLSARTRQQKRFEGSVGLKTNSDMGARELSSYAPLSNEAERVLQEAAKTLGLSARAYHKVQKLARTIADLENTEHITPEHILESIQYRPRQLSIL